MDVEQFLSYLKQRTDLQPSPFGVCKTDAITSIRLNSRNKMTDQSLQLKSNWSHSKPIASSLIHKLIIRDLDGLVPQISRTFNPTKLEWCKVHAEAPTGVSLYHPVHAWPSGKPLPSIPDKQSGPRLEGELEPGASEGRLVNGSDEIHLQKVPMGHVSVEITGGGEVTGGGGYCECCNLAYRSSLELHCQSKIHKSFMGTTSNFSQFDAFVARLQSGVPLRCLPLVPPESSPLRHPIVEHAEEVESIGDFEIRVDQVPLCEVSYDSKGPPKRTRGWVGPAVVESSTEKRLKRLSPALDHSNENITETCFPINQPDVYTNLNWEDYDPLREEGGKQLHKQFSKYRDGSEVTGKVEGWALVNGKSLYSVVYGDGDMEEMSSEEVVSYAATPRTTQPPSLKQRSLFQTAKTVLLQREKNIK